MTSQAVHAATCAALSILAMPSYAAGRSARMSSQYLVTAVLIIDYVLLIHVLLQASAGHQGDTSLR